MNMKHGPLYWILTVFCGVWCFLLIFAVVGSLITAIFYM